MARLAAHRPPPGAREIASTARVPAPERLPDLGKRSLLVTFRRDGRAVPTPVWAAPANGRLYVRTVRRSGKIGRLRRDARVLIAPCTARGRPLGAPFEGYARVLGAGEEPLAERALHDAYGAGRALFEWWVDVLRVDMCYLEIVPGAWGATRSGGGS
jgi:PPOX class probable F420-dependent enzyme